MLWNIGGLKLFIKVKFKYGYQEDGGMINTRFEPKRTRKGDVSWTLKMAAQGPLLYFSG